jgi:hypothetical protein
MHKGQVMLITVLAISGTILGATTIAGLLTLYQIRQSTDIVNSTKAIFAADSGLEWRLYKFFKGDEQACIMNCPDGGACPAPELQNNSAFNSSCVAEDLGGGAQRVVIRSVGTAGSAARAFEITLE